MTGMSGGATDFPVTAMGARSSMLDVLGLIGAHADDPAAAAAYPASLRRLHAGEVLFHEGSPATSIYFVRAGTFKIFNTAEDGYEQVLGFSLRTELLGFDAICLDHHPTAAVALEDSSVYGILVRDLFAIGLRLPALDRQLHRATSLALAHGLELADVMAAVSAEVRLARFLVQWSRRMVACGQSPRRFHLRMSRRDIASYLGVAHETVSRSFSALQSWGQLRVTNRDVEIVDLAELTAFARSTRKSLDERHALPGSMIDRRHHLPRAAGGHYVMAS
jgi:CRP/FNR family transcriptional regulator, anaerobic regulatory protein